jgi:hypothetical protein
VAKAFVDFIIILMPRITIFSHIRSAHSRVNLKAIFSNLLKLRIRINRPLRHTSLIDILGGNLNDGPCPIEGTAPRNQPTALPMNLLIHLELIE